MSNLQKLESDLEEANDYYISTGMEMVAAQKEYDDLAEYILELEIELSSLEDETAVLIKKIETTYNLRIDGEKELTDIDAEIEKLSARMKFLEEEIKKISEVLTVERSLFESDVDKVLGQLY